MKRFLPTNSRTAVLAAVLLLLLGLFVYVALRSGPLASVPVTLVTVERREITPALFRRHAHGRTIAADRDAHRSSR